MDQEYHTTASTTVAAPAFNPYLPAIGRVLEVLLAAGPAGSTICIKNRDLAEAIGLRSAGHIPRILRALEADGYIERVATRQGSLIVVVADALIPHADQRSNASQSDPARDQAEAMETRDHAPSAPHAVIPHADPPLHPPIRNHDSCMQQQHAAHANSDSARPGGLGRPDRGRPDPVFPAQWRQMQDANPGYTAPDFFRELAAATARPDVSDPLRLVVGVRIRGECVYSQEELHARAPERDRPASASRRGDTNARRRRNRNAAPGRSPAGGATAIPVDYAALLAEIEAADACADELPV